MSKFHFKLIRADQAIGSIPTIYLLAFVVINTCIYIVKKTTAIKLLKSVTKGDGQDIPTFDGNLSFQAASTISFSKFGSSNSLLTFNPVIIATIGCLRFEDG